MAELFNVEIKARCPDRGRVRKALIEDGAVSNGVDLQVDTYFRVSRGRLKLRESRFGDCLIHYHRPDQPEPKESDIHLEPLPAGHGMKVLLMRAYDVLVVVRKDREIHWIENVKFHLDQVPGLGEFVEIEAIDADGRLGPEHLLAQCRHFMERLGIDESDLLEGSYSDMLLARERGG